MPEKAKKIRSSVDAFSSVNQLCRRWSLNLDDGRTPELDRTELDMLEDKLGVSRGYIISRARNYPAKILHGTQEGILAFHAHCLRGGTVEDFDGTPYKIPAMQNFSWDFSEIKYKFDILVETGEELGRDWDEVFEDLVNHTTRVGSISRRTISRLPQRLKTGLPRKMSRSLYENLQNAIGCLQSYYETCIREEDEDEDDEQERQSNGNQIVTTQDSEQIKELQARLQNVVSSKLSVELENTELKLKLEDANRDLQTAADILSKVIEMADRIQNRTDELHMAMTQIPIGLCDKMPNIQLELAQQEEGS